MCFRCFSSVLKGFFSVSSSIRAWFGVGQASLTIDGIFFVVDPGMAKA